MHPVNNILKSPQSARASRRGFTTVELLLATVGISFIAIGISSMLTVVAYGTTSSRDMRSLVVKQKASSARLTAAIRGSRMVLEMGDDYFVLWTHDDNENEQPDFSEIRLVEYDADNEQILSYKLDILSMNDALIAEINAAINDDVSMQTSSDFGTLIESFKDPTYLLAVLSGITLPSVTAEEGQLEQITSTLPQDSDMDAQDVLNATLFTSELWATRVSGLFLSVDHENAQQAGLLNFQITFDVGTLADTVIGTASLRNE